MKCNVGGADRVIRLVLVVVFLLTVLLVPIEPWQRLALLIIAAIALLTALLRFCPLNRLLGLNTCRGDTAGRT